jgi:hypothetical protein
MILLEVLLAIFDPSALNDVYDEASKGSLGLTFSTILLQQPLTRLIPSIPTDGVRPRIAGMNG